MALYKARPFNISAQPMTLGAYCIAHGWQLEASRSQEPGYAITYLSNGMRGWVPAALFEENFIPL